MLHIILVSTLSFSEMRNDKLNYLNNTFMFKPMILSEASDFSVLLLNKVDSSNTVFSVKEQEYLSSFQEQFKDYPIILYLDDIYQNFYRYSSINTVLFQNEDNLLSLLSNYDVSCSKIKLSIKYNFK
ncbi:MAG: hypothetical protein PF638_13240 [Candidatus Delongbacteria bacterium]|nr:hypothetical protein [Candidatus Delongbacteria bacterium]